MHSRDFRSAQVGELTVSKWNPDKVISLVLDVGEHQQIFLQFSPQRLLPNLMLVLFKGQRLYSQRV